mgnify:CR=1 FL=1
MDTSVAPAKASKNAGKPEGDVDNGAPAPGDPGGTYLWHTVVIGDFILPVNPNDGSVVVEAESGGKKDKKKAAGKSKSKTTKQGKEDVKIKIHCEFTRDSWGDGEWGKGWESALAELDPCGTQSGGPFAFSHPDTNRRGVKSVMVDKIGKVAWKGYMATVEIDCSEWTAPDTPKNDNATKTPKTTADGSKWVDTNKGAAPRPPTKLDAAKQSPAAPNNAP